MAWVEEWFLRSGWIPGLFEARITMVQRNKVREFCGGKKKSNGGNGQISQLTNLPKKRRTEKFLLESASAETVARG